MSNKKRSFDEPYTFYIPQNFATKETIAGGMLKVRNVVEAIVAVVAIGYPLLKIPMNITVKIILMILLCIPIGAICLIGINHGPVSEFIIDFVKYKRGVSDYVFKMPTKEVSENTAIGKNEKGEKRNEE